MANRARNSDGICSSSAGAVTTSSPRIAPTLCVGMPQWTLRVRFGTRSVPGCIPTQSVGTINYRTETLRTTLIRESTGNFPSSPNTGAVTFRKNPET
ncbi:hypothetical protein FQ192_13420 [Pseudomonas sp. ANT_J12]|nr:hypothetical protein FQ192_13420 [Pseudomonas sp. ANT_J12]